MEMITHEEIMSVARKYGNGDFSKLDEDGKVISLEISKMPAVQKMATMAATIGILTDPLMAIEMMAAACLMMGIEIGQARALRDMTQPKSRI